MMTVREEAALSLGAADLLMLYEQMEVIRRTERAAHDLFLAGLVKGTTHLAAGHEAVAVGANAALRPGDYVLATYRGHHHAIARGATPAECLAELMSRGTGLCGAKGGSMHLTKASAGMLGSYAIVGAHLPMAAGAAWSAKLRSRTDPATYRPAEEVEQWLQRDPLELARQRLAALSVADASVSAAAERAAALVALAVEEAREAPPPDPATAFTDVAGHPRRGHGGGDDRAAPSGRGEPLPGRLGRHGGVDRR